MILLYIISLLAILVLFAPSQYIPSYITWPVSFLIVILVVFLFNLCKKDTKYLTKDTKKNIVNRGLYNPLILYVSASLYIFGFTLICAELSYYNVLDFVKEFNVIIKDVFGANHINNVLNGLILILIATLMYFLRYAFKDSAGSSGIKLRSFWYISLSIISIFIGLINSISFKEFDLYKYLLNGYNLYFFLGLLGLILLIDFICFLSRRGKEKRIARKEAKLAKKEQEKLEKQEALKNKDKIEYQKRNKKQQQEIEKEIEDSLIKDVKQSKKDLKKDKKSFKKEVKLDKKQEKKEAKLAKKQAKKDKKKTLSPRKQKLVNKLRAKMEKKLAKKEAKIKNKIAKIEEKQAKKSK
jgi:hypothetical protein